MKKILIQIFKVFGYSIKKIQQQTKEHLALIIKGKEIINKISPDLSILNGPFKGMRYPSLDITELALIPKITGGYEEHLSAIIQEIIKTPYSNIIDIGCAEGYYAVGLARLKPECIIHCYDINEADLRFCKQMADLNNVTNVTYNTFCSSDTLINFKFGERSLIFCDCEGYELELFTEKVVFSLKDTDVLIEMHDNINPIISTTLLKRFSLTHDVMIINNSNVESSHLQGLDGLSPAEKAFAAYQHRGGLYQNIYMEWAFFTPKK